jgi:DNA-binding transcriptional regulator YdaS (Cro superfamily)
MENAITKAIKLAGNQSKLARLVGISPQALSRQIRDGNILPKHCITIENCFPGEIFRNELNPQHFGNIQPESGCVVIVLQNFQSTSTTI